MIAFLGMTASFALCALVFGTALGWFAHIRFDRWAFRLRQQTIKEQRRPSSAIQDKDVNHALHRVLQFEDHSSMHSGRERTAQR